MRLERPANEADGARSGAVASQALDSYLDHLGARGEAEVVVRGEDDHLPPPRHLDHRSLWRDERVEALVRPCLAQRVELGRDRVIELLSCRARQRRTPSTARSGLAGTGLPPG